MKKIVYVTGSRAEFGRDIYILKAIEAEPDFELNIIATGTHLSREFGYTVSEIERDFDVADRIEMLLKGDSTGDMAKSLGKGIMGITDSIEKIKPDLIIVAGDRGEALAGAIVGSHLNIPVAHVGGGYVSGSIDNKIRDAVTIFSKLHFVANNNCAKRVKALGAKHICISGAPDLEAIRRKDFCKPDEVTINFNVNVSKPLIMLAYHPVTDEYDESEQQMETVLDAISELKMQTIVTYPNADAGGRRMAKVIEKYRKHEFISFYKHIDYKCYLGLLNIAALMVGNSSAGLIEAPSFCLPAINIGSRQVGRDKAENVVDIKCDKKEIMTTVMDILNGGEIGRRAKNCKNPYGDGHTSELVINEIKRYFGI